jgi:MerR family transcriptional regulator, light-induced transcriptional regulator
MTVRAYRNLQAAEPAAQGRSRARQGPTRLRVASKLDSMLSKVLQGLLARSRSLDRLDPSLPVPPPAADACAEAGVPHPPEALAAGGEISPDERVARIVRTIEADIIPRLVRRHRPAEALPAEAEAAVPPPAAQDVQAFVQHVLADDADAFGAIIAGLRQRGVTIDNLYLGLLAPAAQLLGEMWEADRVMFSDVTVAVGQLQRIMRQLSPAFGDEVAHPSDGRRILLMPAPGEQHTFGLTIVADFFRRAGWQVVGGAGDSSLDPVALVRAEWFDVLGISCGGHARLDWLKTGIAAVREASRNKAIGVMVGGPIFIDAPGLAIEAGADATAVDGRDAPRAAEELLASRSRRLAG